jgi:hydroxyacylglutathione hydrolase
MLSVIPIPAFQDNYIWLIRNAHAAAVVDPGDARPVLDYLQREQLQLVSILNTHHHPDHIGGNKELLARFDVPVYGPRHESIASVTHPLVQGEQIVLPFLAAEFMVLDVPGHTAGHIAYYGVNSLFCGDTLFGCGCGRLFEGTPAQMWTSLQKLASLPDDTRVYCAHEYTLANIAFALAIDPRHPALLARAAEAGQKRAQGLPTLPSTIALEKATNPFLRCTDPSVVEAASQHAGRALTDPTSVFAELRAWKNHF